MLKSISYTATFMTTGRTLAETINFQTGFGTITGANEAGKSFVVEMIRWCLFGSAALRGKASEFRNTKAELVFVFGGEDYTVNRTMSAAKISRGGVEIAVGITPTNNKVVELLGFGMDVFDVACVANQGDLEKLATMKPTERKRMVDSVIGLGVIEDLGKWAGEEALAYKRQATAALALVREPEMPERPEGYRDATELAATVLELRADQQQASFLKGWLAQSRTAPVVPKEEIMVSSEVLRDLVEGQRERKQALRKTEMELATLPAPSQYTAEALDAAEECWGAYKKWKALTDLMAGVQQPKYTDAQLDEMTVHVEAVRVAEEALRLEMKIKEMKKKGTLCCPACNHSWPLEQERITQLESDLEELGQVDQGILDAPFFSEEEIGRQRIINSRWAAVMKDVEALGEVSETARPAIPEDDIETSRRRLGHDATRVTLTAKAEQERAALQEMPDFEAQLTKRLDYEQARDRAMAELLSFNDWQVEAEQKRAELTTLEAKIEGLDDLTALLSAVTVYDDLMLRYGVILDVYNEQMADIEKLQEQVEQWNKVKAALQALQALVKQHLVPSLNKVASHYLQQMTGGQRQTVQVDDEFNIMVDGQSITTLSGSGKAVANLALRFALGQVLTNNVFSLFIGDEIDSSMDKDRAENTAATLQTLKGRISQILLVTHKFPEADYYITVGNQNAQDIVALE